MTTLAPAGQAGYTLSLATDGDQREPGPVAVLEGTSGVTLHRRVTSDNIQMIASLVQEGGSLGILTSLDAFLHSAQADPALHRFLATEPEVALRVLTSRAARVQAGSVAVIEALLAEEADAGHLRLAIDLRATYGGLALGLVK